MLSEIKITNRAGSAVIDIEGVIGVPEQMQFDNPEQKVATYAKFTDSLNRITELKSDEVIVNIRSTGGDVNDALLIYEALGALRTRVVTRCFGYVASAATIIAQAASSGCREISANTLYLIHCSEGTVEGNSMSLKQTKDLLDKTDDRIAGVYAARSGREVSAFVELMGENNGKGRWLTAQEAVDAGLADVVTGATGVTNSVASDGDAVAERASEASSQSDTLQTVDEYTEAQLLAIIGMLGITPLPAGDDDGENALAIESDSPVEELSARVYSKVMRLWQSIVELFRKPKVPLAGNATEISAADQAKFPVIGRTEPLAIPANEAKTTLSSPTNAATIILERRNAQSRAKATSTKPKEDPSVMDEYRRSPNEQAYEDDIRNIRTR